MVSALHLMVLESCTAQLLSPPLLLPSLPLPTADPSDFKFDSVTLTFNPGETFKDLMVFVEDDKDNLEPDEQFVLSLRVVALTGSTGEIESTTVNITDDKGKHVIVTGVTVSDDRERVCE